MIMSLVRFTIPPLKLIVNAESAPYVNVTSPETDPLDESEPMVPINGLVVSAEKGFTILPRLISTSLTKSPPVNSLLTVTVFPERTQEKLVTLLELTRILSQEYALNWEGANSGGNMTVAVAEEGTGAEFQLVGLRESS